MAKPSNSLIGKTRGSVGNVTFTVWKGINVMKEKAENSYSNPNDAQIGNNIKFRLMIELYRSIGNLISLGFRSMAVGMSEYNAFMKFNPLSTSFTGTYPDFVLDPTAIQVSKGSEPSSDLGVVTKEAAGANLVNIAWDITIAKPVGTTVSAVALDNDTGERIAVTTEIDWTDSQLALAAPLIGTNVNALIFKVFYNNGLTGVACDSVTAVAI